MVKKILLSSKIFIYYTSWGPLNKIKLSFSEMPVSQLPTQLKNKLQEKTKFSILNWHRGAFETFYNDQTNSLGTGSRKEIQIYCGLCGNF